MVTAGPYWVTAHPVSWLPYELPAGDDRQISSEDRRSVKLRVRPPLPGTHRCHSLTLAWSAWLYARFLRGRGEFAALERWQMTYLPVYSVWAAVVVVVFPPLFGFA